MENDRNEHKQKRRLNSIHKALHQAGVDPDKPGCETRTGMGRFIKGAEIDANLFGLGGRGPRTRAKRRASPAPSASTTRRHAPHAPTWAHVPSWYQGPRHMATCLQPRCRGGMGVRPPSLAPCAHATQGHMPHLAFVRWGTDVRVRPMPPCARPTRQSEVRGVGVGVPTSAPLPPCAHRPPRPLLSPGQGLTRRDGVVLIWEMEGDWPPPDQPIRQESCSPPSSPLLLI